MKKKYRRHLLSAVLFGCMVGGLPGSLSTAVACPSCKAANESDTRRPRAYMYSILFMLAMPATVFTGFGVSFYRLSKKAQQEQLAAQALAEQHSTTVEA